MDGHVDLHFHVQSGTRRKTFGNGYRVEQHHASKAANLRCPEGSFRTFSARVVRRALSKWTSPAAPEPGSYWGAQGTQGQGRKQTNVHGTPPTAPEATSWPQPTADLLQGERYFALGSEWLQFMWLLQPQVQSHESLQSLHREQLLSTCHGTAPKGGDRDTPDKPYNTSITASMAGVLPR